MVSNISPIPLGSKPAPARKPMPTRSASHSRSEEHTSELQSRVDLVCRLLLEKKNKVERQSRRARRDAVREDRGGSGHADRPSSPQHQPRRDAALVERTARRDVAARAPPPATV